MHRVMIDPESERTLFVESLLRMASSEGLGVAPNCLQMTTELIDSVVRSQAEKMADPALRGAGMKAFEEFVGRMIEAAKSRGYRELHEDTFLAARKRCGLLWWCD
jgi:hypothetical protein